MQTIEQTANIAGSFRFGGGVLSKSIQSFSEEEWFRQPDSNTNHLMFIMGHLVLTRAMVLRLLGKQWSAPWEGLFARGAALTSRDKYPPVAEILAAWEDMQTRVPQSLESATPEMLTAAPPPGPPSFDGTLGGVIAFLSAHEWYHVGQVALLSKQMGHGQVAG